MTAPTLPAELTFDERGLVPVIAQDACSGEVLMFAWATREAVEKTLQTRQAHYFSRSRGELWRKGATSGHVQEVLEGPLRLRRRRGALPRAANRRGLPHGCSELLLPRFDQGGESLTG